MIKATEVQLMRVVLKNEGRIPSDLWEHLTKQDYRYLDKWSRKNYWDYGVSPRSGWLTDLGWKHFNEVTGSGKNPA